MHALLLHTLQSCIHQVLSALLDPVCVFLDQAKPWSLSHVSPREGWVDRFPAYVHRFIQQYHMNLCLIEL